MVRLLVAVLLTALAAGSSAHQAPAPRTVYYADTVVADLHVWVPEMHGVVVAPTEYRQWWAEISRCAHRQGDFTRIRWNWSSAPKDTTMQMYHTYFTCPSISRSPFYCVGWWSGNAHHDTFVAIGHLLDERVIKHEMLHDLLGHENAPLGQPHHLLFQQCGVE